MKRFEELTEKMHIAPHLAVLQMFEELSGKIDTLDEETYAEEDEEAYEVMYDTNDEFGGVEPVLSDVPTFEFQGYV